MPQPSSSTNSLPEARIVYRLEPHSGVFIAQWFGVMTDQVLLSHYQRYYSAPGYDPTCRELADLRGLSGNGLTTDGIKKMSALAKRYHRSGLTAIVTESDLSFGLGRMYNVLGPDGTKRIEVFRDLVPALTWLGVPTSGFKAFETDVAR